MNPFRSLWHTLWLQGKLIAAYFIGLKYIFALPAPLRQPESLASLLHHADRQKKGATHQAHVDVPRELVDDYTTYMESLKADCLAYHDVTPFRDFDKQVLPLMMVLRVLTTALALWWGPSGAARVWLLMALQFVIAPLSLVPAVTTVVALAQPHLIGHLIVMVVLTWGCGVLLPEEMLTPVVDATSIEINAWSVSFFVVVDQLLCAACLYATPGNGRSEVREKSAYLKSVLYGFVNCKTYQLTLFALLWGYRVNCSLLVVDYVLRLSQTIGDRISLTGYTWSALFYHEHRIAHLPVVYQHAHKFHHYLHGTTAFDAHIYGMGMPEEYGMLLAEYGMAAGLGIAPPCLNLYVLYLSWTNKVGHTMKQVSKNGNNAHSNHHIYHVKNYGIYDMGLDLIMGTCAAKDDAHEMPDGYTGAKTSGRGCKGEPVYRITYTKPRFGALD